MDKSSFTNHKNHFSLYLTLAMFTLLTACQSMGNDWDRLGLKGKVKRVEERTYNVDGQKFGEWQQGRRTFGNANMAFDANGGFLWTETLDRDLKLNSKYVVKRQSDRLFNELFYNAEGQLTDKNEVERVSANRTTFVNYDMDGNKRLEGDTYLRNHKLARQEFTLFEKGVAQSGFVVVFEYDEDGNLIRQKQTRNGEELTYFARYEYLTFDDKKNWTKRLEFDEEDATEPVRMATRTYLYFED